MSWTARGTGTDALADPLPAKPSLGVALRERQTKRGSVALGLVAALVGVGVAAGTSPTDEPRPLPAST